RGSGAGWSPHDFLPGLSCLPRRRPERGTNPLFRRLAQAVAGDPLAVRIVVRNPGHSRRARVLLSCARRTPAIVAIAATPIMRPANIRAMERTAISLPPADVSTTRRPAPHREWRIPPTL